jgi:hypothetical protein
LSGTSAAVTIARTPFIFSAALASSFAIPACGCGERSALTQAAPGTSKSSTKTVRPVTCATPS